MNNICFQYNGDPQFKGYYNTFMECLKDISDEETQLKEWKKGNHDQTIVFSFSEIYQDFIGFTETIFVLYKDVGFSEEQLQMIKKLYTMVEGYDSTTGKRDEKGNIIEKTDAEIADDPKWHEIRGYAKEVYKELKNRE